MDDAKRLSPSIQPHRRLASLCHQLYLALALPNVAAVSKEDFYPSLKIINRSLSSNAILLIKTVDKYMSIQTAEIISIAKAMPLEDRAEIVDSLLESMQPTDARIDQLWKLEVVRRIDRYEAGGVELVPGDLVFDKIHERIQVIN